MNWFNNYLLHGKRQLAMGAIFSGIGFLLYALAMAAGQLWAADGIVLIFSVVSVYVFASVATERRRNKNEVSLNLFLGQAAVTILTCLCAVMTLREKTGF